MVPAPPTRARPALSEDRIVAAARELLIEGGPEHVVIRELARRLGVAPSSLYKHVAGREDVLTLLIAACYEEAAATCEHARDAEAPGAHRARLTAASLALRRWALTNRSQFDLILGAPLPEYAAPPDGPTDDAARRFGLAFAEIYAEAARDGALRLPVEPEIPEAVRRSFGEAESGKDLGLGVAERYLLTVGFQRLLGLISVEASGQLDWSMADTEPFVLDQLRRLTDDLLTPGTP